ncbi:MAG: hypothetical protein HUU34_00105 [Saprospiraceae bacterium]|nr:hypothetical protein [Saprospiraceae bacterium]
MNRKWLFPAFLLGLSSALWAQQGAPEYLQGYAEEAAGKRFAYHSPFSNVTPSLLLRGQADYSPIEWKTEPLKAGYAEPFVSFIWLFGMDVTPDPVVFRLSVNGEPYFYFENSRLSRIGWSHFDGPGGARLSLNVTMLDKYEDQMGFAILKLPVSALKPGLPVTLKVDTDTRGNNAWFMTFKTEVKDRLDIYQNDVVVKKDGRLWHSVSVDFIHTGEDVPTSITILDQRTETVLKAGVNKVEILLPKEEIPAIYKAVIQKEGSVPVALAFDVAPVREWEIFLVQHTHTDIGYTRPQTEILPEHLRYIDNALDFCDQTDDYPDAAKFRWTCETSWSVREFLKTRPKAQIERLVQRIKEGRIEATGMFLNFSEIIDEPALAAQTKTLRLIKDHDIDVTTAMQNDVNGIAWALVDYFQNTGVKYLDMGIHAHRARRPFAVPTAFWWQSPAGNRILAFRAEHYMMGNALSLTTGQMDVFRANLADYLQGLVQKGYPYDKASLQFSGYTTDNSPPSTRVCDIIREWNEKYEWPKLRSSLARDFLVYLEQQHGQKLATQQVAWPDWWTDGVGSAANETKTVRNVQSDMAANTALLVMAKWMGQELPAGLSEDIGAIYDNLLFYDEHTHGAAESISDPLAQNTVNQWGMKSAYAWDAAKRSTVLQEKALATITAAIPRSPAPQIAVFNTLNWPRSGVVELFIPYEVLPAGSEYVILDSEGQEVPAQMHEQRMEGAYYELYVEAVPPLGYKTLHIRLGKKPAPKPADDGFSPFENAFYSLVFDESKGGLTSVYDKELKRDLIDANASPGLGQFIYEQLANRHEMERLTQVSRDTVYKPLTLTRETLKQVRLVNTANGSIYKSIFLHGNMPVCADSRGVHIEIRLYHSVKRIDLLYQMVKLPVQTPEGVYVAFPFHLEGGKLAFEAQGGVVYPGVNQLEGSSSDWNTIQHFASVKSPDAQIVFVSKDIPLVQFGDINTGRYYYRLHPATNHLYSWVLNNYWVTNFKASQEGELRWRYSLTSSGDPSDLFATRFGWGVRTPLLSRVLLPQKGSPGEEPVSVSLAALGSPNILLVQACLAMDGRGVALQVREVEGKPAVLDIPGLKAAARAAKAVETNILEEKAAVLNGPLALKPYETKFIKLY